tara:strand:+ start:2306 stop:3001 length:696 start_codon:yes stop_codon:yes gene_type:complete
MKTNKELGGVIDALGKWRFYLGIKEKASKEEIIINVQFIRDHFGNYNVNDIHEAMQTSIAGKLDVDNNHYGNFGPLYISRVLNAYKNHKSEILQYCKRQLDKNAPKALPERNPKEELDAMKTFFLRAHKDAKDEFFNDYGDVWYNFAKRNGYFNFTQKIIEDAKRFGKLKANDEASDGILMKMQYNQRMKKEQRELRERSYARSFVVNLWLKSINNPKEFTDGITFSMLQG